MKISEEKVEQIKKLHEDGFSYRAISKMLGVGVTTVYLYLHPQKREEYNERMKLYYKKLYKEGKTWGQRNPEKAKAIMRKNNNERYHNDSEFREKQKKTMREIMKKYYLEGKTWQQKHPEEHKECMRNYRKKKKAKA